MSTTIPSPFSDKVELPKPDGSVEPAGHHGNDVTYRRHALSECWPDMGSDDFQSLRDSIQDSGLRDPIVMLDGKILDGWQRYQACIAEGVPPRFEEYQGDDPVEFVRDKHTRRPLNLTQRLTALALMYTWRSRGAMPQNSKSATVADITAAEMAAIAGGSTRSAESVKAAVKGGMPEVIAAMKAGTLPGNRAADIAKLPKDEQVAAITNMRSAKRRGAPLVGAKADATRAALAVARAHDDPEQNDIQVKPEALQSAGRIEQLEQQVQALKDELTDARDTMDRMSKVMDSSDQVATALEEAAASAKLASDLKQHIQSMTTQIRELKNKVAYLNKIGKVAA